MKNKFLQALEEALVWLFCSDNTCVETGAFCEEFIL